MLKQAEKSYFLALQSLKEKKYALAADFFDRAAPEFSSDRDFVLLRETTRLLIALKRERKSGSDSDGLDIEEVFTHG